MLGCFILFHLLRGQICYPKSFWGSIGVAKMKFTDKKVLNLKPRAKRYEVFEGNGLGVRVTPRGTKSWVVVYHFHGKSRRMTLGKYPQMTVAKAHKEFGQALERLEQGSDPGAARVEDNSEARKAPTVDMLVDEYMEKWAKPRKRSWAKDQSLLDNDVKPIWGRRKAKDITRRDVITLLDKIVDRGAPIQANRVLAVVRKMFNFAISRDMVDASPCVAVQAPAPENRRDRVLTKDEVRNVWLLLEEATQDKGSNLQDEEQERLSMASGTALAIQFQLVTAQRKGEVAGAEWSEIDLESGWWVIPAEKSKNKLPHRVPLSPFAQCILKAAEKKADDSPWVFPSPRDGGEKRIADTAIDRAVRNNRQVFGIEPFTPHDLRRTAASFMTSMGISRLVVSKILNHAEQGVTAVYDRHSYDSEKRRALNAWSQKLSSLISDSVNNVVDIRG